MYIYITSKTGGKNPVSSKKFVKYLEKENLGKNQDQKEYFFTQTQDRIPAKQVVAQIDRNTGKLKKGAPRFYSITVNPSKKELGRLKNPGEDLRKFTRKLMENYCSCFNREINGKPVSVKDLLYFAKIEHQRKYNWKEDPVKENLPYEKKIRALKTEIKEIEKGGSPGNIKDLEQQIKFLEASAPHRQDGKRIVVGMPKKGLQSHIHIIMSRMDASNSFGLSPGSTFKAREVLLNGKWYKAGFDREAFFNKAEKTFDKLFGYQRNYVEFYESRKVFKDDPKQFYSHLARLSPQEKTKALRIIGKNDSSLKKFKLSRQQVSFALSLIKKAVDTGIESSSIGR